MFSVHLSSDHRRPVVFSFRHNPVHVNIVDTTFSQAIVQAHPAIIFPCFMRYLIMLKNSDIVVSVEGEITVDSPAGLRAEISFYRE